MPRLGMGMPIAGGATEAAVLAVEDFVFLNDVSGELTPVDTSSRTNLIPYSHDFSQSDWQKVEIKVETSGITDPSGGTGSYKLTTESNSNQSYMQDILTTEVGKYYTFSVYAQKAEYDYIALVGLNPLTIHYINLANGTTSSSSGITPIVEDASNGWFRCSITLVADTTSKFFGIYLAGDNGNISQGGAADDNGVYIYGAQVEQDSRVSALIKTSGSAVNVATTELGDLSNVWDFDGTDIMLEVDPENEGAFEEATANLVTNHDFAVDANWTKGTGWSISGGKASNDGSFGGANSFLITSETDASVGDTYEVTFTVSNYVQGSIKARAGQGGGTARTANGTYTETMVATATETIRLHATDSFIGSVDNVFVKEYAITPLNV